jgi:transposase
MGHGKQLTGEERGQIKAWLVDNVSVREMARRLKRNKATIANYIRDPEDYGKRFVKGRPSKLSEHYKRRLFRTAANSCMSAGKLVAELQLNVTRQTVANKLNGSVRFKYKKINVAPKLTPKHEKKRLAWATNMVDFGERNWRTVIFSDEKKWNLDGPDGHSYYWYCLGREEKTIFSRQNGGGSVMIWAGMWSDGTTQISFVEGNQKSTDYIYTWSEYLLPSAHLRFGTNFIFQQDNARIHTARNTKDFFNEEIK